MKKLITMLLALPVALFRSSLFPPRESCANGWSHSPHPEGAIGRVFVAAMPQQFLLAKVAANGQADLCGVNDEPLGPCMDTPDIGERATIHHLGSSPGSKTMIASAAIADGARVYTSGAGKVSSVSAAGRWLVGKAISVASGDGQPVEIDPCFPVQQ